jgi:hypothetical protein
MNMHRSDHQIQLEQLQAVVNAVDDVLSQLRALPSAQNDR